MAVHAYGVPEARREVLAQEAGRRREVHGQETAHPRQDGVPYSVPDAKDAEACKVDPAKGNVLGQFILYAACAGQQKSALLGYSPLPENLVLADFDAVRRIPGAPAPPPLSECANPTINGGGGGGNGGGGGGGGGDTGNGTGSGPTTGPTGNTVPGSSGATSGPSAGPDGSGQASGLTAGGLPAASPLPSASARALRELALRSARATRAGPSSSFAFAAACVLVFVFGPILAGLRRLR